MAIYQDKSEMIPEGEYPVTVREEVELANDPGCNGADAIKLFVLVEDPDGVEPWSREVYQVIDPDVPARGSARATPYDFTMMTIKAFGATREEAEAAILGAAEERANGGDVTFTIPGLGSTPARVVVKHKLLDGGKWAENLQIRAAVATPAAMGSLAAKLKARGVGGKSASPFAAPGR